MRSDLYQRRCRIGPVACTLRSLHNFDALHVRRQQMREIEVAAWLVDRHAINEEQVGILAATSRIHTRRSAAPAGVSDGESWNIAEQFINRSGLLPNNLLALDDRRRNSEHAARC